MQEKEKKKERKNFFFLFFCCLIDVCEQIASGKNEEEFETER